jgi:DNA-binding GntR family transcriptional regulator
MPRRAPLVAVEPPPAPPAAPIQPIVRQTLTSVVLDALRDRILAGGYAEGAQLRQEQLAAELGVSRIPVREALRQLEAEGLVTFNPHRGAVVSSFSVDEIDELFELRALVEGDLMRRAVPRLTDADFRRADEILDLFEVALRRGDVAAWGDLNWRLHSTLYAAAGRPMTLATVKRLHRHSERYMRMQLALTHGESRANEEHRAIVAAARAHDARRAASLLVEHVRSAGRSLVRYLARERSGTPRAEGA